MVLNIDDFEVFDHPDSMDQNLIDALLGLETSDEELEKLDDLDSNTVAADVIPFPTKEINELEEQLLGSENSSLEVSSMRSTLIFFKSTNNTSMIRLYMEERICDIRKEKR